MVLDDRERQFEAEFARRTEARFKHRARRDKLFGLWAAGRLGLAADAADRYARGLVEQHVGQSDDAPILAKVAADLAAVGATETVAGLRAALERCAAAADDEH